VDFRVAVLAYLGYQLKVEECGALLH
jgi:hypothetical protein